MSKNCAMRCACGLVCQSNQDCLLVDHARGSYCVCDGRGDGRCGFIASHVVRSEIGRALAISKTVDERMNAVDLAVGHANAVLRTRAAREGLPLMNSAIAVLLVESGKGCERPSSVGWSGDSRIYRFRGGQLDCLTLARSRTVGTEGTESIKWKRFRALPGDVFLLATNGLSGLLPKKRIKTAFIEASSAESIADRLEAGVIAAGATDNYTFVVCRIE